MIQESMICENSVVEDAMVNNSKTSITQDMVALKMEYEKMYDLYLQRGYDVVKRDFNLDISKKEFLRNCSKYIDNDIILDRKVENEKICRRMYEEYIQNGFEGVVEKFLYMGNKVSLVKRFKNVLPEYDSRARRDVIERKRVDFYTKIYDECKKNGFDGISEKFGCSSNRKFLCKQFSRYVKGFEPIKGAYSKIDAEIIKSSPIQRSNFWEDFDFSNATVESVKKYLISHSDYDKIDYNKEKMHYLIYMIVNKINGKIYVGQHQTNNINDDYMGSGIVVELAEKKYGMENFEKLILFDFDSFDEMNDKEVDIVCNEFLNLKNIVYNRCNGGFNGPNSDFQKMMYRTGQWLSPCFGKVVCHNAENKLKYFYENEIPDGWVKGDVYDVELHAKLDKLMDELHSLGSNYVWHQGDTVEKIQNMIEQFKKANAEEEQRKVLWKDIFEYYKQHGRTKTVAKYETVEGIVIMDRCFDKYFPTEFAEFKNERKINEDNQKEEFNRIRAELESYGMKRPWESYRLTTLKRMYNACMSKKKKIDEKIEYYKPLLEECYEHGIYRVMKKYGETNLHYKFAKYLPLEYKAYMKNRNGKDVEVNENVYASLAMNATKERKKRELSESTLKRMEAYHNERVRLFNELTSLGAKVTYREDMALTTLRRSIKQAKINKEKMEKTIHWYNDFYRDIMQNGYRTAAEKRNYTGTLGNLKKRFKSYVPEFKYGDFTTKT